MKQRIPLTCKCGQTIMVMEDDVSAHNAWECTNCRTKDKVHLEVFPSLDPSLARYIDQRTSSNFTLTWWRESDFFRHRKATVPLTLFPTTKNLRGKLRVGPEMRLALEMVGRGFEPFDKMLEWAVDNVEKNDLILVPDEDDSPEKSKKLFDQVPKTKGAVLAPIRGRTLPEMERWVKTIESRDGYYVAPYNDLGTILSAFILHQEFFPNSRLHIKGVSGTRAVELLGILIRRSTGTISVETSSHLSGLTAGIYYQPQTVRGLARLLKGTELESIPCDCPVCRHTYEFGKLSDKLPALTVPIALHNLYQFLRYIRIYENITRTVMAMEKSHAGAFFSREVLFLDEWFGRYLDVGYENIRLSSTAFDQKMVADQTQLTTVRPDPPPPRCAICEDEHKEAMHPYLLITGEALLCDDCWRFYEEAAKVMNP